MLIIMKNCCPKSLIYKNYTINTVSSDNNKVNVLEITVNVDHHYSGFISYLSDCYQIMIDLYGFEFSWYPNDIRKCTDMDYTFMPMDDNKVVIFLPIPNGVRMEA